MFESSVNSEGIETGRPDNTPTFEFESSVNSEGIETAVVSDIVPDLFESSVNSEGIETRFSNIESKNGLRAV